jgi:hypothetical protein
MRFYADMTQAQIAGEIGVSQMCVSRLLARTLAQLRDGMLTDVTAAATRRDGGTRRPPRILPTASRAGAERTERLADVLPADARFDVAVLTAGTLRHRLAPAAGVHTAGTA